MPLRGPRPSRGGLSLPSGLRAEADEFELCGPFGVVAARGWRVAQRGRESDTAFWNFAQRASVSGCGTARNGIFQGEKQDRRMGQGVGGLGEPWGVL